MLHLMEHLLIGLNKLNQLFHKDMVDIFTIVSSLEAPIFVLRNNLLNPNNFAHGAKDLNLFITISFVKGFQNGKKKIII
jgi:hypothetical protein